MIIEPNEIIFENLCENLGHLPSYDGGDTGYLNAYFKGWFSSAGAPHKFELNFLRKSQKFQEKESNINKISVLYRRLPFAFNAQRYL